MELMERAVAAVKARLDKLTAEGSADAIADVMEMRSVKAVCVNASRCALAVDLERAIGEELGTAHHPFTVSVPFAAYVSIHALNIGTANVEYVDPLGQVYDHPINQFIWAFDKKTYPNLILGRSE